jgi:5-methylcytosine-specific restriction endonuclease McrA
VEWGGALYTSLPYREERMRTERMRKTQALYYQSHKAASKVSSKKWAEDNPEIVNANHARYMKAHPAVRRANEAARRTRKTRAGGSFTPVEWKSLCKKYRFRCLACNKRKPLQAEHVVPVSKGGSSNIRNIQPLCQGCNARKGTKSTDYRR